MFRMKVAYEDEVRVIEAWSYAALQKAACEAYLDGEISIETVVFTYLDADQDRITIASDADLTHALSDAASRSIVTPKVEMRIKKVEVSLKGGAAWRAAANLEHLETAAACVPDLLEKVLPCLSIVTLCRKVKDTNS